MWSPLPIRNWSNHGDVDPFLYSPTCTRTYIHFRRLSRRFETFSFTFLLSRIKSLLFLLRGFFFTRKILDRTSGYFEYRTYRTDVSSYPRFLFRVKVFDARFRIRKKAASPFVTLRTHPFHVFFDKTRKERAYTPLIKITGASWEEGKKYIYMALLLL